MRHLSALLATVLLLLLLLCSCDGDARGMMISSDGGVALNTPVRHRAQVIAHLASGLDQQLGAHWRSTVTILELPVYDDDYNRAFPDNWYWDKATVAVVLVGDGQQSLAVEIKEISDAVWDYMHRRVDRPKRNLTVNVSTQVDAARFAALQHSASTPTAAGGAAQRTYTVQKGDTLAIISSVFYGTPDRWRQIVAANPGLDAANLVPGTQISIPPATSP